MTLAIHFSQIKDQRVDYLIEHALTDILTIAICATICGADGWEEISEWGTEKKEMAQKPVRNQ